MIFNVVKIPFTIKYTIEANTKISYMASHTRRALFSRNATLLAAGLAIVGAFVAYSCSQAKSKQEEQPKSDEYRGSKCIILTPRVREVINLKSILKTNAVVLLPPGVLLHEEDIDEGNSYKVIPCDSWKGVWACVRHLRFDSLLLNSNSIPDTIPHDIARYVSQMVEL
ncbi:HDL177Cp [Eremothecium sinecaudum]|uniref:Peroxisome assembly protein 22 n=1 Tax=Eremothecium sinecaudum TaxID=45286 RepID=A0A109UWZ7_9SACH|nr:HDL177Cp [Eremothecium sinecaudum]AMD20567.1 HDL177Cp [Eremothecium sinecaudum]